MITSIDELDLSKRYTYADYLTWKLGEMVELIQGKIFRMSPAPSLAHQKASSNLHIIIGSFLRNKDCRIFSAPFDVRLPLPPNKQTADKIDTVVQPDISIICDASKLDEKGCIGPPEWIIEIISPATSKKDHKDKFELYQNAGVNEYWLVYPTEKIITSYYLGQDGIYLTSRTNSYVEGEFVPVKTFEGFQMDVTNVFM